MNRSEQHNHRDPQDRINNCPACWNRALDPLASLSAAEYWKNWRPKRWTGKELLLLGMPLELADRMDAEAADFAESYHAYKLGAAEPAPGVHPQESHNEVETGTAASLDPDDRIPAGIHGRVAMGTDETDAPIAPGVQQTAEYPFVIVAQVVFNSGFFQNMFATRPEAERYVALKLADSPEVEIREIRLSNAAASPAENADEQQKAYNELNVSRYHEIQDLIRERDQARERERQACNLMVVLRCEADLKEGCSKQTTIAMGQWLRGEKPELSIQSAVPPSEDAPATPQQPYNVPDTPEYLTRWIWQHYVGVPGADEPPYDKEFTRLRDRIERLNRESFVRGLHEGVRQTKTIGPAAQPSEKEAKPWDLLREGIKLQSALASFADRQAWAERAEQALKKAGTK